MAKATQADEAPKRSRGPRGDRPITARLEGGGYLELRVVGAVASTMTEGDFARIQAVKGAMGTREGTATDPLLQPEATSRPRKPDLPLEGSGLPLKPAPAEEGGAD